VKNLFLFVGLVGLNFVGIANADTGEIQCWGSDTESQLEVPQGIVLNRLDGRPAEVHFTRGETCIRSDKGKINCWGVPLAETQFLTGLSQVSSFALG